MNLQTEIFGTVVVVHTPDELSNDMADNIERFLTSLERSNVVLDLDNTEMIDSDGLTALLDAQEKLHELGGDLKISTSNHANRKILEIPRLDAQLEVFGSVVDAVRSFV